MTLGSRTVPQDEEIGMKVEQFVVCMGLGLVVGLVQARAVMELRTWRTFADLLLLAEYLFPPGTLECW